jgi:hypothetical protein
MGPHINDAEGSWDWWSQSDRGYGDVRAVRSYGDERWDYPDRRAMGSRPASLYSEIQKIAPNGVRGKTKDGVTTYQAGEYPQQKASDNIAKKLNELKKAGQLQKVPQTVTLDSRKYDEYGEPFRPQTLETYILDGKKYTCCKVFGATNSNVTMSDGSKADKDSEQWFEWQPITWLIDEKKNRAVAQDILFSGVHMNANNKYGGNLEQSDIGKFLRECFSKDTMLEKLVANNKYQNIPATKKMNIKLRNDIIIEKRREALRKSQETEICE